MLPTYMTQSQVFWQRGRPSRNIRLFSVFVPTQDTEKPLSRMFPANWGLALTFQRASSPSGKSCQNAGSLSALWLGSTIPAVFPKTMKCLSVLHKLFAPLLPSALYSSGFSLLVQLLNGLSTLHKTPLPLKNGAVFCLSSGHRDQKHPTHFHCSVHGGSAGLSPVAPLPWIGKGRGDRVEPLPLKPLSFHG